MTNIIKINNFVRPKRIKAYREDVQYFAKQLAKAETNLQYCELVDKIYIHGFEDGYQDGRKNGKVVKLILKGE